MSLLIGKYLYTMVVEGEELMHKIRVLFETNKPFTSYEVKLVERDTWLTLSAGPMNENLAIIVATGILSFSRLIFVLSRLTFFLSLINLRLFAYITQIKLMAEELNHALTTKSRFLANMSHEVCFSPFFFAISPFIILYLYFYQILICIRFAHHFQESSGCLVCCKRLG